MDIIGDKSLKADYFLSYYIKLKCCESIWSKHYSFISQASGAESVLQSCHVAELRHHHPHPLLRRRRGKEDGSENDPALLGGNLKQK